MSYDAFPAHESTRKRRRWGCTCGCLMLLVILLVGGSLFSYLALRPYPELRRYALIDQEVNGYGVVRYNPDDNGTKELTAMLFKQFQESERPHLDENEAKLLNTFIKNSQYFVNNFIHRETTVLFNYDEEVAEENVVVAVPLKNRLAGVLPTSLLEKNLKLPPSTKVDGANVFELSGADGNTSGSLLALSGKNVMYSDSFSFLEKTLGYAGEANRAAEASPQLQTYIDELGLDQPVQGEDFALAFVNAPSRILNMILSFEEWVGATGIANNVSATLAANQLTFDNIAGVKITGDLVSSDRMKAELTFYTHQSEVASRLAAAFKQTLPGIVEATKNTALTVKADSRTRGNSVLISIDISGIRTWVESVMPVPGNSSAN